MAGPRFLSVASMMKSLLLGSAVSSLLGKGEMLCFLLLFETLALCAVVILLWKAVIASSISGEAFSALKPLLIQSFLLKSPSSSMPPPCLCQKYLSLISSVSLSTVLVRLVVC